MVKDVQRHRTSEKFLCPQGEPMPPDYAPHELGYKWRRLDTDGPISLGKLAASVELLVTAGYR
jgi:hypothetical protein